jgi:hypothetical protein
LDDLDFINAEKGILEIKEYGYLKFIKRIQKLDDP